MLTDIRYIKGYRTKSLNYLLFFAMLCFPIVLSDRKSIFVWKWQKKRLNPSGEGGGDDMTLTKKHNYPIQFFLGGPIRIPEFLLIPVKAVSGVSGIAVQHISKSLKRIHTGIWKINCTLTGWKSIVQFLRNFQLPGSLKKLHV